MLTPSWHVHEAIRATLCWLIKSTGLCNDQATRRSGCPVEDRDVPAGLVMSNGAQFYTDKAF